MKTIIKKVLPVIDLLLSPFTFLSTYLLFQIRKNGIEKFPISRIIFKSIGLLPIRNHYYEPLIHPEETLPPNYRRARMLNGIDFNLEGHKRLIDSFDYNDELMAFPRESKGELKYFYNNDMFGSGDSEYYYNLIRNLKPKRIIEIGSGNSTLMALNAIEKNKALDSSYNCDLTCIEPYEMPWLEKTGATIIRKKVEDVDLSFFQSLDENDILFIDSSHVIRPMGDVVFEFLTLLPSLKKGVIVHVHDIFTPLDYPEEWLIKKQILWNEQYLFEAFLTNNTSFEIIGALSYLKEMHPELLYTKCPVLKESDREPASFWIKKTA